MIINKRYNRIYELMTGGFEMWVYRRALHIAWMEKRTNNLIINKLDMQRRLSAVCFQCNLYFFSHIICRSGKNLEKLVIQGESRAAGHMEDWQKDGWAKLKRRLEKRLSYWFEWQRTMSYSMKLSVQYESGHQLSDRRRRFTDGYSEIIFSIKSSF